MATPQDEMAVTGTLRAEDYGKGDTLKTLNGDANLVVGAARKAEAYITNKQWNLLWRDADLLYQSPRPLTMYENTYVLEPNVQRFTVAKVANAVVPQLYKGLFYTDPPMLLRPRPGTTQETIDAKTALFSYLLDACRFKTETKWGLEQMAVLGTGIFKWGIEYCEVTTTKRKATISSLMVGPTGAEEQIQVPKDDPPQLVSATRFVPRPFFESRPLDKVLVDPKCNVGDIRHADFVIDVRYMDFHALNKIRKALTDLREKQPDHPDLEGWEIPTSEDELRKWWMPPVDVAAVPLSIEQATYADGAVHHAEDVNIVVTPDLLFAKKEVLEYWDKGRKIMVIDRKKVLFSGKNPYHTIPFLSANWWNRSKAFYGMGLGLIVGQNQRVNIPALYKLSLIDLEAEMADRGEADNFSTLRD